MFREIFLLDITTSNRFAKDLSTTSRSRTTMKFELATALAVLQVASAHTLFTTLFVNDINQGDGTCIRMPMTPANATFPVTGGSESPNMACGMFA